jgi:hypothetical protein
MSIKTVRFLRALLIINVALLALFVWSGASLAQGPTGKIKSVQVVQVMGTSPISSSPAKIPSFAS